MTRNIGVELNLVVDKINHVSSNYIPPTFNTCIKTSIEAIKCCQYYLIIPLLSQCVGGSKEKTGAIT